MANEGIMTTATEEVNASTEATVEAAAVNENANNAQQENAVSVTAAAVNKAVTAARRRNARIVAIDEDGRKTATQRDEKRATLLELIESKKAHKILTGTMEGVEILDQGGKQLVVAVLHNGPFKVFIPLDECIKMPATPAGRDPIEYASYVLSLRLGSEIDYIVAGIEEEKRLVYASRTAAMLKKRRHYFFVTDRRQRHRIEEGDIVEARVVATARAAIVVEVCGVEAPIKVADLDWARIQDAKLAFTVGDRVMCKVMNIEKNSKESTVHLTLSRKETIENPYIIAMQDYNEGCKYVGTVSMVSPSGVFVHLAAGVDVLCNYPTSGANPQRGSRVTVRITTKVPDQDRIFGVITHVGNIIGG